MPDFWTVTSNPAGYEKLAEPLAWTIDSEVEASDPVKVLDVGSSDGSALTRMVSSLERKTGREFETVNLDPQGVIYKDKAQSNSDHLVRGMAGNIGEYSLPIKPDSVDIVVSNYLLPFLERERQSSALREVEEVLQPGGAVGVHVDPHPYNEDSISSHWVMNYEDFTRLEEESQDFSEYPITPEPGTNFFYSDNRDRLPNGFYDQFRDKIGF